jgi:hypothetical protein
MPTGRQTGHRGPSIAGKARTARANRTAADLAPVIAELRAEAAALQAKVLTTDEARRFEPELVRTVKQRARAERRTVSCFIATVIAAAVSHDGERPQERSR